MASRFILPFADVGNGISPSAGAQLFFFDTGTSTPRNTFSDEAATTPNTNPVIADGEGVFSDIWIVGSYKVVLKDKNDVQIWEADPVREEGVSSFGAYTLMADALGDDDLQNNIGGYIRVAEYTSGIQIDSLYMIVASGTGAADGGAFNDSTTAGLFQLKLIYGDTLDFKQYGVIDNDPSAPTQAINTTQLNAATLFAAGKVRLIWSFENDVHTDNTVFIYQSTWIKSLTNTGIVRQTTTVDSDGLIAVMSVGVSGSFITDVRVEGRLKLQFTSGLAANTRGDNTIAFYAGNMHTSTIEIFCLWAEKAWSSLSNFNIDGLLKTNWCHHGLDCNPLGAGSAGNTCTSFDLRVEMDFTIFPFVLTQMVYSKFTGFVEAIRQSYAHYEADEMSVIFTLHGCTSVNFEEIGIEAVQSMILYNHTLPSYCRFGLNINMTDTDHFAEDAARINNIALADQAVFSTKTVGTFDFDTTLFSGSAVTVSTGGSHMFRKDSDQAIININGGFIEPGPNYTYSDNFVNFFSNGSRFYAVNRYTALSESRLAVGNGMVWIDVTGLVTDINGEVVVAPPNIKELLIVSASVIRGAHNTDNNVTIKTKTSAVSWTLITGLTTGFGIDCKVLAIEN